MRNLVLIKLGGSVITNKKIPYALQEENIIRLSREIAKARRVIGKDTFFVIGNGGGSFSHPLAAKYGIQNGFINKRGLKGFSLTSNAEIEMNRIVMKYLIKAGLPVVSFAPASFVLSKNHENGVFLDPIREALTKGIIPVVYGDMIIDTKRGCIAFSAEKVLGLLAGRFKPQFNETRIINCTETEGVYDQFGKTIPKITPQNFTKLKKFVHRSDKIDITGGMLHKVNEALKLAKNKISSMIISGQIKGNLFNAILGDKVIGTVICKS